MNITIDYYSKHAADFVASTQDADMTSLYQKFLSYLPTAGQLLDCGCGSGRDTKYFAQQGYKVTAIDATPELCRKAKELTGQDIICMTFDKINWDRRFDGIWACASLLHLPKQELPSIFNKLTAALKPGGHLYCSFKYGDFEGERNGRYFSDLTEKTLDIAICASRLIIIEQWKTEDVRPNRNEIWLNTILAAVER